jgi:hypothetical protein
MPSFTLATLQQMVLDRLDNNTALYTDDELTYIINECVRVISLFTGFFRSTVTETGVTVANQIIYNTPSGMLMPLMVAFNGRQIQKTTLRNLSRRRRNWAMETTAGFGQTESWAPLGLTQFVMYPIDSTGGNTLIITGLGEPPLLVNPGDTLVIENEYVELITAYGAHRGPLKEGGKIFADGSLELKEFYSILNERKRYQASIEPRYWLLQPKRDVQ